MVDGNKGSDTIDDDRNPDGHRDQKEGQPWLMTAKICLDNHENETQLIPKRHNLTQSIQRLRRSPGDEESHGIPCF
jgi:hypothetical protein